jgi:GR25 family glycosyltransferase involved in LPS biosynthesis
MHSKIAGCVPIYWGDSDTSTDFTPNSFINLSHLSDPQEIRSIIREIENNVELCNNITNTPLLDDNKYNTALSIISNISQRILSLCNITIQNNSSITLLNKVDKVVVINLDRRSDRWDNWRKSNPVLSTNALRFSAVDGKQVKLTQAIYNIFKFNTFNWKRAMVGCTLSHMSVWLQLLAEPDNINSYLILEDDMRFATDDWLSTWQKMSEDIPEDAEILYIGGVLPSNKKALPMVLDPVNNSWAKIKPNTLFGTKTPQPMFHFCAYSYILTKRGAQKLLDWLAYSREKCFTCNDHLMGHPIVGLNKYISIQQITKCFQEDDEAYTNSDFNTVDRADTFDSDIWNSIDNFNSEELAPFVCGDESIQHIWIPIWETLKNMNVSPITKSLLWPRYFINSLKDSSHKDIIHNYILQAKQEKQEKQKEIETTNIYYLKEYEDKNGTFNIYEKNWIKQIFGDYTLKVFDGKTIIPSGSWFIAMRPFSNELNKLFTYMHSIKQEFKVLHLSDEFGKDNIEYYKLSSCKCVLRNYIRDDLPNLEKIHVIPLGYHYKDIYSTDSDFNSRKYVWSFHGTDWFNRRQYLNNIMDITPHNLHFTPNWNHSTMTNEQDYIDILTSSKFCPILRGNNVETFRLYESLEHGVIPIYVRNEGDDYFWKWITEHIKLIEIKDWVTAKSVIKFFLQNPDKVEKYRTGLIKGWETWKKEIKQIDAL